MLKTLGAVSRLRVLSLNSTRAFSQFKPARSEDHGHEHHHGEELSEDEVLSKKYIYSVIAGGALLAYYTANESYKKSHAGEPLASQIFSPVRSQEEIIEDIKVYNENLKTATDLTDAMSIPAPERLFHDYSTMQLIRTGSPSNYVPGTLLNVENIGPRRQKKSIFD